MSLNQSRTMAEGLSCTRPEEPTFSIIRRYADDVVVVTEEEIAHGVQTLLEYGRLMAEPSGAAAPAALLTGKVPLDGRPTVAVVSGGNMDWPRLAQVMRRRLPGRLPLRALGGWTASSPATAASR